MKSRGIEDKHDNDLAAYQKQYTESAYYVAKQRKQTSSERTIIYSVLQWVGGILSALLVAYIVYLLGWN